MKKDLHPSNYRFVVFKDMSNEYSVLTKSCVETKETIKWEDGNEYPLIQIRDFSHFTPFLYW
jgi:large subunit ribosomal protein L31